MKAKVFDIVLHELPGGTSPAKVLEEQLNGFLAEHPKLRVVGSQMNTAVLPPEPAAMPRSQAAQTSMVLFFTLLYEE
jgi:hypothetical protein